MALLWPYPLCTKNVLYQRSWTKFSQIKLLHFDSNVINVCSQEAIPLTKDDPGLRPIMASLGYKNQYSKMQVKSINKVLDYIESHFHVQPTEKLLPVTAKHRQDPPLLYLSR